MKLQTTALVLTLTTLGFAVPVFAKSKHAKQSSRNMVEAMDNNFIADGSMRTSRPRTSYQSSILRRASVLAGGSFGMITSPGRNTQQLNPGFGASATVDIGRGRFVFETGLAYLEMGTRFSSPTSTTFDEIRVNMAYVAIPLNAKFYFTDSDSFGFYGKLGALPMIKVNSNAVAYSQGSELTRTNVDAKTFDLAGNIALGTRIGLASSTDLVLEGMGFLGAINVDPNNQNSDNRNFGFAVMGGVSFGL